MHFKNSGLIFLFLLVYLPLAICQFKSLDFGINVSSIADDYEDEEYIYDNGRGFQLSQFEMGYTTSIGSKFTISPKVAYALAFSSYSKNQVTQIGGSLADRTFIRKSQKGQYIKLGLASAYWINRPGKGLYVEAEWQNLIFLSAKSDEMKRVGAGNVEMFTVDIKENFKSFVPSLRIGVGFNVPIKNINVFINISRDLRFWTYFKTTNNYTILNRSLSLGARYTIQHSNIIEEKNDRRK